MGRVVRFGNKDTNPNISLSGQTIDGVLTNNWKVENGRDLRQSDIDNSTYVCILGKGCC